MKPLKEKRPLSTQEHGWIISALSKLPTGEHYGGGSWKNYHTGEVKELDDPIDPAPLLTQVPALIVVAQCDCGDADCHTVQFEHKGNGSHVSISMTHTEDGRLLNVDVDHETGEIVSLEVI